MRSDGRQRPHSEETKQKISRSQIGIKNHFFGKKHSEETKRKMAEAKKGRKRRPMSEETKQKLSKANKGNHNCGNRRIGWKHTEEALLKMSAASKGRKFSDETKKKIKEDFLSGKRTISHRSGYGKGGFREDLGYYVRSKWEANVARILTYENITYQYEPKRFDLGKNGTYLPDFYIPQSDFYIEVKGYMSPEAQVKLEAFEKDYDLLLITKPEYNILVEKYSSLIDNWEK